MSPKIQTIGANAFNGCRGLVTVVIPDSVVSIGSNAFANTSNSLTIINKSAASGRPWGATGSIR